MKKSIPTIMAAMLALSSASAIPLSAAESDYLLHSTFEEGTDKWSGRGSASVKTVSGTSRSGEYSLFTSGRESSWNGASVSLGSDFKAGQDYAFSAYVMTDAEDSVTFYLTLQYSDGSTTSYPKIAEVTAKKGEWAHLEKSSFTIPAGATNISLYIETEESKCNFYVDEVAAAPSGTTFDEPSAPVKMNKGDINYDGCIDSFDIILARKGLINPFTDKKMQKAADADSNGVYEIADAVLIMQFVSGKIKEFPVAEPAPGQQKYTTEELTEKVQNELVNTEPNDSHMEKQGVKYGTIKKETYFSKKANKNKNYNILLPADYDESKQYPVLYLLHGFFENEDRMITKGNGTMYTKQIIGNAIASGEAKDMIVVVPFVFTSATMNDATGFADQGSNEGYDNFVDDIVDSLMPHIESKYSVATGRENTAVTGFSMGGRESLQIGMKYGDKFGYVGAICPAPGASGSWKWNNSDDQPYLLMITGGTQDDVVGLNTPEGYHNNFNKNNVPHVWHVVQGGHHGDDSIHSALYCFVRGIFQATDGGSGGSSSQTPTQTPVTTTTKAPDKPITTTQPINTSTGQRKYSMKELTEIVQNALVNNEPNDSHNKKNGVQYGTIKKETYFSKKANKNKPYNILLPANYDSSKKYPVLYLLHGFFENENRMITQGNGTMYTQQIIGNAIAEGAAKDMIVVVPFVFTSATMNDATGFADQGSNEGYDNFVDDIVDSLMPHIESKYSVATGRENTAVTGFSMGGRESLQIGMKHGDKFGYVGAICPAPGASGSWKWNSESETPYLVMITGGTADDVVGLNTPEGYHNNFNKNNVPHVWHVVQGGHHGDDSIHSALYCFVRGIFQATD